MFHPSRRGAGAHLIGASARWRCTNGLVINVYLSSAAFTVVVLLMPLAAALLAHLRALPSTSPPILLTLAELEALAGEPLPAAAGDSAFWASSDVARELRAAGFVSILGPAGERVLFARVGRFAV